LSDEWNFKLSQRIRTKAVTGSCFTKQELVTYIEANIRANLIYERIHCFLQRRADEVTEGAVALGELPGPQVPRWPLDQYIGLIEKWVPFIWEDLIFNLDKTGLSDWEGFKPKPVMVPTDLGELMIHCPVNRQARHQIFQGWISASRDACCPLLVPAKESAS
jgi:hypothetical protein